MKQILVERSTLEKERRSHYEPVFEDLDSIKQRVRQIAERIDFSDPNDLQERKSIQEQIDQLVADLSAMKTGRALEYDVLKSLYLQTEQSIAGLLQKHELSRDDDDRQIASGPPSEQPTGAAQPPAAADRGTRPPDADADKKNAILAQIKHVEKAIDLDGGQYGGWDEHDHRHFVKLWHKLDRAVDICERGAAEIYGQTPQTVMEHCKWFDRYNGYLSRKKDLIASWRTIKDAQQKKTIDETAASLSKTSKDASDESIRRQQEEKDAALRKWKDEKAKQEAEKALREAETRAQAKDAERLRLERRARILHEKVEKFHEQVRLKASKENRPAKKAEIDEHVLEKIRSRNSALLSKRRNLMASKQDEIQRPAARAAALAARHRGSVRVQPDPSRLLKATEAARVRVLARQAERSEPKNRESGAFILAAQHRSVPLWRRGV